MKNRRKFGISILKFSSGLQLSLSIVTSQEKGNWPMLNAHDFRFKLK